MFCKVMMVIVVLLLSACGWLADDNEEAAQSLPSLLTSPPETGGYAPYFKIPLPSGFAWEVTQSWAEHCEECNDKGYDKTYGDYCSKSSHQSEWCLYGWDFNLYKDEGKSVLASSFGQVYKVGYDSVGWGRYILIDHGDDVCTRYAHLLKDSVTVSEGQSVCQGLKIGQVGGTPKWSPHLHFQFESCTTKKPLKMGFTDGNGIPKCTIGKDLYDSSGKYNFLKFTNKEVESCDEGPVSYSGAELTGNEWVEGGCSSLPGCPLQPNCDRQYGHKFDDERPGYNDDSILYAKYLHSECAFDGNNNNIDEDNLISRAEALKIALFLFGLMDSCGSKKTFEDVDPGDWYFPIVACAVKHGLINSVAEYFRPNDLVTSAEAAKFVVESALEASAIQLQSPSGDEAHQIPKSHWAYKYFQTLAYYGAMKGRLKHHYADTNLTRHLYMAMVTSLSPCFCGNVRCASGCVCDQATYACVDPSDVTPGTGGGGQDYPDPEPEPDDPGNWSLTVEECFVDLEHTKCEGKSASLYIKCELTNVGDGEVKINNLILSLTEQADKKVCEVTDADLRSGVGTTNLDPGETDVLSGHFEVECESLPSDEQLEVSFDLVERIKGVNTTYSSLLHTKISLPEAPFLECESLHCEPACSGRECGPDGCGYYCGFCKYPYKCDYDLGQCYTDPPPDPEPPACETSCFGKECGPDGCGSYCGYCSSQEKCNSDTGQCYTDPPPDPDPDPEPLPPIDPDADYCYEIGLYSPGGSIELIASGPIPYYADDLPLGDKAMYVAFDCVDLPSVILVKAGYEGFHVWRLDDKYPFFEIWYYYDGPLTFTPFPQDQFLTPDAKDPTGGFDVLIRINKP